MKAGRKKAGGFPLPAKAKTKVMPMRPVKDPDADMDMSFKKGGKVVDGDGKKPKKRGDRKPRKSGGRVGGSPFSAAH